MSGWIAVSRKLFSDPEWSGEQYSRREAWIDLIVLARFELGEVSIAGRRVTLQRGQLAWSVAALAERWQWSKGKVDRFLTDLELKKRIERLPSHVTSITTITNYDRYQFSRATDHATESTGQLMGQPTGQLIGQPTTQRVGQLPAAINAVKERGSGPAAPANGVTGWATDGATHGTTGEATNGARTNKETINNLPPLPPKGSEGGWGELIQDLEGLGVKHARSAAEVARDAGCSADDFRPHLEYWKSHRERWASPAGVLFTRLRSLRPGLSPQEPWPEFDEAKEVRRRREEDERIRTDRIARERREREAEIARTARREEVRPKLTRLSKSDHAKLRRLAVPEHLWRQPDSFVEGYLLDFLLEHPEFAVADDAGDSSTAPQCAPLSS